jgi:nitrogen fixation/metabolism regulation signal transduction histidine kinase
MSSSEIVQYAAMALMFVGLIAVFHNRHKSGKGLGARVIQLLAVIFVVPAILILGLAGILKSETIAALFGTLIGYLLSGIGDFRPDASRDS